MRCFEPGSGEDLAASFMTADEVRAYPLDRGPEEGLTPLADARARMVRNGQWHDGQAMGRRWPIGCVALEITQRCNLDCTLCYLSESAEAVHDLPLDEIFRRIDEIRARYGARTDVQVTGGDPTLRERGELVRIVRRIAERGMRPALFTNGIRARRDLLIELRRAGLGDVAFHVDMTQNRRGYASEVELNEVRRDYIERARGLGLSVVFNTTVTDGNIHELPALARFFAAHSDVVSFASFQLQADQGRGVQGARAPHVTMGRAAALIREGTEGGISFGFPQGGHARCNLYGAALVASGRAHDFYEDRGFTARAFEALGDFDFDRRDPVGTLGRLARRLLREPGLVLGGVPWAMRLLWRMRRDLWAARGRVHRLSFFIHNFMDAGALERERLEACVFSVATGQGFVPMCLHNARRDAFVLRPVETPTAEGPRHWQPLTGRLTEDPALEGRPLLPRKRRKGAACRTAGAAERDFLLAGEQT